MNYSAQRFVRYTDYGDRLQDLPGNPGILKLQVLWFLGYRTFVVSGGFFGNVDYRLYEFEMFIFKSGGRNVLVGI